MEEKQLTSRELEEQANALLAEADFEEIKLPKKAKKAAAAKKAAEETAQPEKPAEKFPPLDEKLVASLPAAALLQGNEKLMDIFAKGKAKGKLSSADLMETLDEMNLESEQLDQIYDSLETLGIDIGTAEAIDSSIDDVEPPMEEIAEIEEEELVDPNELVDSFSTDDPVRMYLKEIGKVSLLSADEEISLATAMSAGVEAKQKLEEAEKNGTELSLPLALPLAKMSISFSLPCSSAAAGKEATSFSSSGGYFSAGFSACAVSSFAFLAAAAFFAFFGSLISSKSASASSALACSSSSLLVSCFSSLFAFLRYPYIYSFPSRPSGDLR